MPSMDSVVTSLGDVRSHTRKVAGEVAARWNLYFIWGIAGSGEHAEGRALDFMTYRYGSGVDSPGPVRVNLGWEIARHLWRDRERLGVWYVMYRRQIISINNNTYGRSGQWNDVPDRGGPTANHMDHVHVSFVQKPPTYRPPKNEQEDDVSAKDVWTYETKNIRLTDDMQREEQSEWNMATFIRDIEATTDYVRRQVNKLSHKVDGIANAVWSHPVQNADSDGPGGGTAPVRWHIKDLERTQDSQGRQLDRIEAGLRALAAGLGPDTANAVNAAVSVEKEGAES